MLNYFYFCTESDSQYDKCSVNLGLNCHGKINVTEPYDFAVKLSGGAKLELNDDLVANYGCDTEVYTKNIHFAFIYD